MDFFDMDASFFSKNRTVLLKTDLLNEKYGLYYCAENIGNGFSPPYF